MLENVTVGLTAVTGVSLAPWGWGGSFLTKSFRLKAQTLDAVLSCHIQPRASLLRRLGITSLHHVPGPKAVFRLLVPASKHFWKTPTPTVLSSSEFSAHTNHALLQAFH